MPGFAVTIEQKTQGSEKAQLVLSLEFAPFKLLLEFAMILQIVNFLLKFSNIMLTVSKS